MVGITDYGFYIPKYRIKVSDIASQWGKCSEKVENTLQVHEKAVAGIDEDVLTMAYEASIMALSSNKNLRSEIGSVFVGSETFPYAVKPTSSSLGEWLGLSHNYLAYDTQFACKAATGALISAMGLVKSEDISAALVCGSDKANARPKDALEYSAASGANAWVLGCENVIAEIVDWTSFTSDTPDFWRRSKAEFPSHAGRFTGTPAYFYHITRAIEKLLQKTSMTTDMFAHVVFHMPNGSFPLKAAKILNITKEQMHQGYIVKNLGNSYSASALMGLVSVFDVAKPGEKILFASYGSGAGSDAIIFNITDKIVEKRKNFLKMISEKTYIHYITYSRNMGIIK